MYDIIRRMRMRTFYDLNCEKSIRINIMGDERPKDGVDMIRIEK